MTREELENHFTEVIHVGYEEYPVWELLQKYYTIEGVSRYYLPVEWSECRWVVTVASSDCCGRYTHDKLHDDDFHLKSNQALQGDWLLKPGAGFWKIVTNEWVQEARDVDVYELDMREVSYEELCKQFNSYKIVYPPKRPDRRPLMQIVQHLKSLTKPGERGTFFDFGHGLKVYSIDTTESLIKRIVGREQTTSEMLEEFGDHRLAESFRELEKEKIQDNKEEL